MGDVYRARDSRLRRDVALKVLPADHQVDAERRARFEREALALAALNHPNIATVLGVADEGGVQGLVMELIDGETLADRIERGGLANSEVLSMARQIVDALEAAHQQGIVHRDLKPANIKIRPDGVLKVLDFGLAKAFEPGADLAGASTLSVTAAYRVLGTPAYMIPEQARGQAVDQRTDIWAFGCVLFEMLSGSRAFDGTTTSDVMAAVLDREPDYERLPGSTPFLVRRLVKQCLEKDQRRRLRDIGDARIDLEDTPLVAVADTFAATSRWPRKGVLLAAALAVAAVVAALAWLAIDWRRPQTDARTVHMTTLLPSGVTVNRGPGRLLPLALSPDGRTLVVAATDRKGERLYKRSLDQPAATALAGTEGGVGPFFSPDGAWVGFIAGRRLKRVPVDGGAAIDIAAAPSHPTGATWSTDDRIVFAGLGSPMQMIEARGGTPTDLLPRNLSVFDPHFLPDGRTVLFSEAGWIHALDVVSQRRTDRLIEAVSARYSPYGYLLVTRGTTLLAAPFDADNLAVTGAAVAVVEDVDIERTTNSLPHLAVSRVGTVAYVPTANVFELVVIGGDGSERLLTEREMLQNPRFSPDGNRVVVAETRNPGEGTDLWVHDLKDGTPPFRLTFDGGRAPVWSRDGASVTYSHPRRGDRWGIHTKPADGNGDARQLVGLSTFHWLVGWTPDQTLAYGMMEPVGTEDRRPVSSIYAVSRDESRRVIGPGRVFGGRLSPDGRWLAYYTQDPGYFEIYVTPFPGAGSRALIAEGTDPAWSPDGSEIYFRAGARLMAARVDTSRGVRVLSQRVVVDPFLPPLYDDYDIHPDGRTLVVVRPAGQLRGREISVLLNWPAELDRLRSSSVR
jgi:Tol biopolymer transport system component